MLKQEQVQRNREQLYRVLGITEEEFSEVVYKSGLRWIALNVHPKATRERYERLSEFWAWWRNQSNNRDHDFVSGFDLINLKDYTTDQPLNNYLRHRFNVSREELMTRYPPESVFVAVRIDTIQEAESDRQIADRLLQELLNPQISKI